MSGARDCRYGECTIQVGDVVKFRKDYGEPNYKYGIVDKKEHTVLEIEPQSLDGLTSKDDYYTLIFIDPGVAYFWWRFELVSPLQLKSIETSPEYEGLFE